MRSYLQKRHLKDGTLSILVRYSTLDRDGHEILRGETIRQEPGEDPRKTEERARNLLAERRTDVVQGRYVPPAEITLGDLMARYLETRSDLSVASLNRYRSAIRRLPESLTDKRIDRIETMDIQVVYGRAVADGLSANGLQQIHKVLGAALRQAVAWGVLAKSPAAGVRMPRPTKRPPAVWDDAEVARFLAAEDDHRYGPLWRLMLTTGMRLGEALALRWSDLDLDRRTLVVSRTMTEDANRRPVAGTKPKTDRSRRTIALTRSCADALQRERERHAFRKRGAPEWQGPHDAGALVFDRGDGTIHNRATIQDGFDIAIRRQGMRRIRVHDMRHTNATNDLKAGVPPMVVADRLGITIKVLLDTYGHALPEMHRSAADALDARLAAATASQDREHDAG